MVVYVVVCTYNGVVNDVLVFFDRAKAVNKKTELESQDIFDSNDDDITLWEDVEIT